MTIVKLFCIFPVTWVILYLIWGANISSALPYWHIIASIMALAAVFIVAQPGMRKRSSKTQTAKVKSQKEEVFASMVLEQEALEDTERKRKASNPVLSVLEYFSNPGRFPEVVKYVIKFVDLGGVFYTKEDLTQAVFFTENRFTVDAKVIHVQYSTSWIYHFANPYKSGYGLVLSNGFQLLVEVMVNGQARRMYINVIYNFAPESEAVDGSGYKVAKQSSPWDVFAGRMGQDAKIRVTGDMFKRVKDTYIKTETADNRWIQPAGLYLVCTPNDVTFL